MGISATARKEPFQKGFFRAVYVAGKPRRKPEREGGLAP